MFTKDTNILGEVMKLNRVPQSVWQNPWHFIAFGFGSGAMPIMPGTFGTLAAIPFYLLLVQLPWVLYILITIVLFMVATIICERVSKQIGVHDHGGIVIDEIIGYFITMIYVPVTWYWILAGFILFRLFDIMKPWPIRFCDQNVQGGLGIMLDDVLAAFFAWVVLQVMLLVCIYSANFS